MLFPVPDDVPAPGEPPAEDEAPAHELEDLLAANLAYDVGLSDEEIASLSPDEAMDGHLQWCQQQQQAGADRLTAGSESCYTYIDMDIIRGMETAGLIRRARKRAGLSQTALAERAGTSQPAIARYEGGRVEPDLSTLSRLATACGFRLELTFIPMDEDGLRRLRTTSAAAPADLVEANRRATRLAAESATAISEGRVRRLSDA